MAKLSIAVSEKDHIQGKADAEITLVEYGDFQCPHCAIAHALVKQLQHHYRDRLRFVFRNFPLEMHPMAEPAAEIAEFAAEAGKFWPMYDAIFTHQRSLSERELASLAESLGLDSDAATAAIENGEFSDRIEGDMAGGEQSGVHGTPTFFINGEGYTGDWTVEDLTAAIDEAIS